MNVEESIRLLEALAEKLHLSQTDVIVLAIHELAVKAKIIGRRPRGYSATREYTIWQHMVRRCLNPAFRYYKNYGGRGICIAPQFLNFDAFLAYMGPCPPGMSLDRIDNNGNYEPGNLRWTDMKTQARNTRQNRFITYNGKTQTVAAWAEELKISHGTILSRLDRYKMPLERAMDPRPLPIEQKRSTKLTVEQVYYIRGSKKTQCELSKEIGISEGQVCRIRNRLRWAWLPEASKSPRV